MIDPIDRPDWWRAEGAVEDLAPHVEEILASPPVANFVFVDKHDAFAAGYALGRANNIEREVPA